MKKPRIPAILLILAMAIPTVLTSCNSTDTQPADTTSAITENTADTAETSSAETTREQLDLPEKSYDGYEFRILAMNSTQMGNSDSPSANYFSDFGYNEERSGEPVNDAVYRRNSKVEETFDVSIKLSEVKTVHTEVSRLVAAGDDAYDVVTPNINQSFVLAQSRYLINMYDIPYLQLDKPWWDHKLLDQLSMGKKIYALTGLISMEDEEYNASFYFNKAFIEKYSLDDPYKAVLDGSWTLDMMYDMGKAVTFDINGDGKLDHNDSYGLGSNYTSTEGILLSTGANIARLNKDGVPELTILEERTVTAMEKINAIYNDMEFVIWPDNVKKATGADGWAALNTMFIDDRLLFRLGTIYNCKEYRNMETDFGMLPYPKYDENQDSYNTNLMTQRIQGISVPTTNTDPERTGIILEALAYHSDIVRTAYYDITLTGKYARDEESIAILDTIFESRCYDIGKAFDWGGIAKLIQNSTLNNGGFVSSIEAVLPSAQTAMEKTYADYMSATK